MWSQIFLGCFLVLVTTVVGLFLVSVLDAVMWAHVYLRGGAIEQLETALYFSMVTFTTLGYGDVTLSTDWRLLASFEAANGIMMFGWSTALIAAFIQRLAPGGTANIPTAERLARNSQLWRCCDGTMP